jgi:hypothetical protein
VLNSDVQLMAARRPDGYPRQRALTGKTLTISATVRACVAGGEWALGNDHPTTRIGYAELARHPARAGPANGG